VGSEDAVAPGVADVVVGEGRSGGEDSGVAVQPAASAAPSASRASWGLTRCAA